MKKLTRLALMIVCLALVFLQQTEANISKELLPFCTLSVEASTFRIFNCFMPREVKLTVDRQFAVSLTKGNTLIFRGPSEVKFNVALSNKFQLLSPGSYLATNDFNGTQIILVESK